MFIILIIISCNGDKKSFDSTKRNTDSLTKISTVVKTLSENTICSKLSKQADRFSQTLRNEGYSTISINISDSLEFRREIGSELLIKFSPRSLQGFHAKSKEAIQGNFYTRFSFYEVCFKNENTAKKYEIIINEIINGNDSMNEKNYDFVVRNGSKLFYVSTNALIFQEKVFSYKDKIIDIIKNDSK